MRKLSLLFMVMVLSMLTHHSKADTVTWDFNDLISPISQSNMPEGWWIIDNSYGYAQLSYDEGVDESKCVNFKMAYYGPDQAATFITKANAGTVSIKVRPNGSNTANWASSFITIFKMNEDGNGGFTRGEKLIYYAPVGSIPGYSSYKEFMNLEVTLAEDCYIGISGCDCFVDNYVNEFTPGGGEEEGGSSYSQNFNDVTSLSEFPEGWTLQNNAYNAYIMINNNQGVDGSACLNFAAQGYNGGDTDFAQLIVKANAGTVSVKARPNDGSRAPNNAKGFVGIYKAIDNGDGTFSIGEVLVRYSPLNTLPDYSDWKSWYEVKADLPEDGYICISGCNCYVDDYLNEFATGGGDNPGPGEGEWVVSSSEDFNTIGAGSGDHSFDPKGLPVGWYGLGAITSSNYRGSWPATVGVDGTPCLKLANNNYYPDRPTTSKEMIYLITYARAGKVSLMVKAESATYVNDASRRAYLGLYTVNGEPENFTIGDQLAFYDGDFKTVPAEPTISADGFSKVEFDVATDGWIAIAVNHFYIDNYENLVQEQGGATITVTDEQDFNNVGENCNDSKITVANLPTGWYGIGDWATNIYSGAWRLTNGVDGTPCISFKKNTLNTTNLSAASYLVTYVHAGTVSFMLKPQSATYVDDYRAFLGIRKVTGEPGSFELGEEIAFYDRLNKVPAEPAVNADGFSKVEFTVEEDGWIAITSNMTYFDNFRNTYEQSVASGYMVSGTVKDEDGNALAGVKVSLSTCPDTTTAEDGSFSFSNVSGNYLNLSVTADGYQNYTETFNVDADKTVDVVLQSTVSTLTVTASDYNNSVTTAVFSLYDGETPVIENVTANEDGKYVFTLKGVLNPEGYTLKGKAPYFNAYECTVKVNDRYSSYPYLVYGESVNGTAYLSEHKLTLVATVVDDEQNYVTDATLSFSYPEDAGATYVRNAINNNDGTYTFNEIRASIAADKACIVTCSVPDMKAIEPAEVTFNDESQTVTFTAQHYAPTVITGKVTNATNGEPLSHAVVTVSEGDDMSAMPEYIEVDNEGNYSFTITKFDTTYTIMAGAECYKDAEPVIISEINREETITRNFALEPLMYTFTATVANTASEAIADATVTLNGRELAKDEHGNFVASVWAGDAREVGEYTAVASAEGYTSKEYKFDFSAGEDVVYAFVLEQERFYTIAGTLSDAMTGEPIASEFVMLLKNGTMDVQTMTDADGKFSFTVNDASIKYSLMPSAEGYNELDSPIDVPELIADGTVTVDIQIQPTLYTFTATVKSENGTPVTDATVIITDENGKEYSVENKNDGTYVYVCAENNMVFGEYTVTITSEGFDPFSDTIEFEMNGYNVEKTFSLTPLGIASLFAGQQGAVNANGKIYVNGNVRIFSVNGMLVRAVSTQEPVEVELEPGIYVVEGQKMMVK